MIVPDAPEKRLEHSNTIANATSSAKLRPSRQDLPPGAEQCFWNYFIPLVRQFAGTLDNPWSTEGMIAPMQAMWDITMAGRPEWEHEFSEDNDPVYRLVSFCSLGYTGLTTWLENRQCRGFMSGGTTSGMQPSKPSRSFGLQTKNISCPKNAPLMLKMRCPPASPSFMGTSRS